MALDEDTEAVPVAGFRPGDGFNVAFFHPPFRLRHAATVSFRGTNQVSDSWLHYPGHDDSCRSNVALTSSLRSGRTRILSAGTNRPMPRDHMRSSSNSLIAGSQAYDSTLLHQSGVRPLAYKTQGRSHHSDPRPPRRRRLTSSTSGPEKRERSGQRTR